MDLSATRGTGNRHLLIMARPRVIVRFSRGSVSKQAMAHLEFKYDASLIKDRSAVGSDCRPREAEEGTEACNIS